jgi:AcrR family transcriptional regulator
MEDVRIVALEMMREASFDDVTVEQIADRAGVSPSTIYRYFGTKDALVLSERRSAELVRRVVEEPTRDGPIDTFRRAATKAYGRDDDLLDDLDLIVANDRLWSAFEQQLLDLRPALAVAFADQRGAKSVGTRDQAVAAASVGVLAAMLARWQQLGGRQPLKKMLAKGFSALD